MWRTKSINSNFVRSYCFFLRSPEFPSRVRSVTRREYRAQGIAGDERHKVHCNHRRTPVNGGTRVYVWQQKKGGVVSSSASNSRALLSVRDLQTHFEVGGHAVKAVDGVSFDVYEGKTLGIVGESGCGRPCCLAQSWALRQRQMPQLLAQSTTPELNSSGRANGVAYVLGRGDGNGLSRPDDITQSGCSYRSTTH